MSGHCPGSSSFVDDGLRENYDIIAPILKEKGVPATFFINSATLDNTDMLYRHKASLLVNHVGQLKHQAAISKATALLTRHGICTSNLANSFLSIRYANKHILDELAISFDLDFQGVSRSTAALPDNHPSKELDLTRILGWGSQR